MFLKHVKALHCILTFIALYNSQELLLAKVGGHTKLSNIKNTWEMSCVKPVVSAEYHAQACMPKVCVCKASERNNRLDRLLRISP